MAYSLSFEQGLEVTVCSALNETTSKDDGIFTGYTAPNCSN
jgi:hypothetical protein